VASVRLEGVAKTFAGHEAVRSVDLAIGDGEFMVLVGPSGCGKSTLLRVIAGLETPTAGRISIGDTDVTALAPPARDVAMVFQSYALYPHMTVRENLAYGLKVRGTDREERRRRVAEVAASLGLETLLDRRPSQLSGGQRQRVALGRAIVRRPQVFLLDEPLSNLDPALRAQARSELRLLHQRLAVTTVYVTHDQEEAMTLGGRVAVMKAGALEQVAPPLDIYASPVNTFVARFIGAPPMNLLPASAMGLDAPAGVLAGIRPHDVVLGKAGSVPAIVEIVEPRGHDCVLHLRLDGGDALVAVAPGSGALSAGARVQLSLPPDRLLWFDAKSGAALPPRASRPA
jgi:ABC-type sugar transport system ATPase subunit